MKTTFSYFPGMFEKTEPVKIIKKNQKSRTLPLKGVSVIFHVFLWIPLLFLTSKKCAICTERTQMKIYSLKEQKHGYLIHTWSDKASC